MPYADRKQQLEYWSKYQKKHRARASINCLNSYYRLKDDIINKLGTECVCCNTKHDLTVDHIVPVKRPTNNTWENLREVRDSGYDKSKYQILCRACNRSKANTPKCRLNHINEGKRQ